MNAVMTLYKTSIGKKVAMAVSGAAMFGFLVVHMLGNLQVYMGPEVYNGYAEKLHSMPPVVWGARIVLLACLALHIGAAAQLVSRNKSARPGGYPGGRKNQDSTMASRTMIYAGAWITLFIIYHLLHFTVGVAHPDYVRGDVYRNFVLGFQSPLVSGFYVLSMIFLGLHLYHGSWSLFQTLGLNHPRYNDTLRKAAMGIAGIIVLGNLSFPISVLTGIVSL